MGGAPEWCHWNSGGGGGGGEPWAASCGEDRHGSIRQS